MKRRNFLLLLQTADSELLRTLAARLRCTESNALRWALRWYGRAGPWRSPDEPLLAVYQECPELDVVGPLVFTGRE